MGMVHVVVGIKISHQGTFLEPERKRGTTEFAPLARWHAPQPIVTVEALDFASNLKTGS